MTEKEKYFDELRSLETTELFLTTSTDIVNEEIEHNCVWVSISSDIAKQVSSADFLLFLGKVKANRQLQLQQSSLDLNIIYYLWFDEQEGQLRFNFINSKHDKLPFGCKLSFVDSEQEIIDDFLNSNYLDGIPWSELETIDNTQQLKSVTAAENANEEIYVNKVYKQIIYSSHPRRTGTSPAHPFVLLRLQASWYAQKYTLCHQRP